MPSLVPRGLFGRTEALRHGFMALLSRWHPHPVIQVAWAIAALSLILVPSSSMAASEIPGDNAWFVDGMVDALLLLRGDCTTIQYTCYLQEWAAENGVQYIHWTDAPGDFVVGYIAENKTIWIGRGIPLDRATLAAELARHIMYIRDWWTMGECPDAIPYANFRAWSVGFVVADMLQADPSWVTAARDSVLYWRDRYTEPSCPDWQHGGR